MERTIKTKFDFGDKLYIAEYGDIKIKTIETIIIYPDNTVKYGTVEGFSFIWESDGRLFDNAETCAEYIATENKRRILEKLHWKK